MLTDIALENLIERLQNYCASISMGKEAADALEAQAKEIQRLRKELAWAESYSSGATRKKVNE